MRPTACTCRGPDLTAFSGGDFYQNEFLPAYNEQYGTEPLSVFHAHAFDAMNVLVEAIESSAVENDDGSLTINRVALRDAVFRTRPATRASSARSRARPTATAPPSVTIGVYKVPDVGFLNPDAKPVFTETKTLDEVA